MSVTSTLGDSFAFVFPGQGSQKVGMGRELADANPAAASVIQRADAVLGFSLSDLMFTGPEDELADTLNAQPAIFTVSIAALEALKAKASAAGDILTPKMVAGHSLGEFTALVAADVLDFETTLSLVHARGAAMKHAGEVRPGAMAAVLGLDDTRLAELVAEAAGNDALTIANLNCPGQTVISGDIEAMDRFMDMAKDAGAKRIARLPISIASHSALMDPAAAELNRLFDEVSFADPSMPIISNSTAQPLTTAGAIREELRHHVTRGVNWTATIETMTHAGVSTFVELGPGSVLAGLNKRIDKSSSTIGLKELGLPPA